MITLQKRKISYKEALIQKGERKLSEPLKNPTNLSKPFVSPHSTNFQTYQFLSAWEPHVIPPIQVVSCFVQYQDRILVLQRAKKDEQHKLWGIPGGKLENNEDPVKGLVREIYEETQVKLYPDSFALLGKALSKTHCDGVYGLFIYHTKLPFLPDVILNSHEHYACKWVTISEFESMNLLTAQFEAYRFTKEKLKRKLEENYEK